MILINLEGCGAFIISIKLANLKEKLCIWSKDNARTTNIRKEGLLIELNSLDSKSENKSLSEDEYNGISQIRLELYSILNQEEIYWKQRSRAAWLKEGNSNTRYFHQLVNGRRNKNYLPRICYYTHWVEGNQEIGKVFTEHIKLHFGNPITHKFLLDF